MWLVVSFLRMLRLIYQNMRLATRETDSHSGAGSMHEYKVSLANYRPVGQSKGKVKKHDQGCNNQKHQTLGNKAGTSDTRDEDEPAQRAGIDILWRQG